MTESISYPHRRIKYVFKSSASLHLSLSNIVHNETILVYFSIQGDHQQPHCIVSYRIFFLKNVFCSAHGIKYEGLTALKWEEGVMDFAYGTLLLLHLVTTSPVFHALLWFLNILHAT